MPHHVNLFLNEEPRVGAGRSGRSNDSTKPARSPEGTTEILSQEIMDRVERKDSFQNLRNTALRIRCLRPNERVGQKKRRFETWKKKKVS